MGTRDDLGVLVLDTRFVSHLSQVLVFLVADQLGQCLSTLEEGVG